MPEEHANNGGPIVGSETPVEHPVTPASSDPLLHSHAGVPLKGLAKSMIIGAVVAVVFAGLVSFAAFGVGVYRLGWHNEASYRFSKILPLPAAKVGDTTIRLSSYLEVASAIGKLYEKEREENGDAELRPFNEIQEQIYLDLIDRALIDDLAAKYNVTVTDEEVDAEFAARQSDTASLSTLGWTDDEVKRILIRPVLVQDKVAQAVASDIALRDESKKKIEDIKAKLDAGGDFVELAKEFSEDGSAADGGDLGQFGAGYMVESFEAAAFALNPGEVSGIVETDFGYHIIKVEAVEKKAGKVEKVNARHILIRFPDFETELQKLRDTTAIQKYVKFPNDEE